MLNRCIQRLDIKIRFDCKNHEKEKGLVAQLKVLTIATMRLWVEIMSLIKKKKKITITQKAKIKLWMT